ncbi:MAG TPA: mechanosensitive ion channel domain-containing protein [Candidatus Angelobacter sp.]|nr:mechanosensitive ion channel domain-containing protein [Candidatus Angelobacter sp.]
MNASPHWRFSIDNSSRRYFASHRFAARHFASHRFADHPSFFADRAHSHGVYYPGVFSRRHFLWCSFSRRLRCILPSIAVILLLIAGASAAYSQQEANEAAVELGGNEVLKIGWGYGNFSPQSRAKVISEKLQSLAQAPSAPPSMMVRRGELSLDLYCGDQFIASVFAGDAAYAKTSREELAQRWAAAMDRGVHEYRTQHSWQRIVLRILLALITVAACIVLLKVMRRLAGVLSKRVATQVEQRALPSVLVGKSLGILSDIAVRAIALLRVIATVAILYFTLHLLLFLFPATRPLALEVLHAVLVPVWSLLGALWKSLPSILFVAIIGLVTWYILKFTRYVFEQVREGSLTLEGFRPAWAGTTQRLVSILIITLAVLVSYPYIPGSQSAAFKGISLFLGVLVSLGSSGLVSNAIAGIMITYMDAFEAGDLVKIGDTMGHVRRMALLTTRIESRKHEMIAIPNSLILGHHVTNYSKAVKTGVIVGVTAGIGYDTPWRQVEAMLKLAASRTPGVRKHPESFVFELSLNSFDITYELNAYLEPDIDVHQAKAELQRQVLDVFNEFGVQIMTPAYMSDPAGLKIVQADQWYAEPASRKRDAPKPDTPQPPDQDQRIA